MELAEYLRGRAAALLDVEKLEAYVMAAESTWNTDPWVLEARMELNRLRRAGERLAAGKVPAAEGMGTIRGHLDRLYSLISARRESSGPLGALRASLDAALGSLMAVAAEFLAEQPQPDDPPTNLWEPAVPHIDALDEGLLSWHRYVSLGP